MKTQQGLTLVELAVTLAVAIVVLAVGIPVFSTMLANNRAAADTNALVTALQVARSEAVKRGQQVKVCAGNGTNSVPTPTACSDTNDWAKGLVVQVQSSGEVLRVWDVFRGDDDDGAKDKVNVAEIGSSLTEVNFASEGRSVGGAACLRLDRNYGSGAIGAQTQRWLAVDTTGRTRVSNKVADVKPPCP